MRRFGSALTMVAAVIALSNGAAAQKLQAGKNVRMRLPVDFQKGPAVGEKLPDVAVYDAAGKPFRLSSLKGSHTVLVFGCLT